MADKIKCNKCDNVAMVVTKEVLEVYHYHYSGEYTFSRQIETDRERNQYLDLCYACFCQPHSRKRGDYGADEKMPAPKMAFMTR
jgi:hypothetical protein